MPGHITEAVVQTWLDDPDRQEELLGEAAERAIASNHFNNEVLWEEALEKYTEEHEAELKRAVVEQLKDECRDECEEMQDDAILEAAAEIAKRRKTH